MIKIQTYKIIAVLLTYPDDELKKSIEDALKIIKNENILQKNKIEELEKFIFYIKNNNLLYLQEKYVSTFDRQRQLSLYLFEHIHGESRERGMAMVDLKKLYEKSNFLMTNENELPDYIPVFLEYLSLISKDKASSLLGEIINIITILRIRLESIKNEYCIIFSILESLSPIQSENSFILKMTKNDNFTKLNIFNVEKDWEEPKI